MRLFAWMFALLVSLSASPTFAYWQDEPVVADARAELTNWEARFVNAVAKPELQWVQQDLTVNQTYQQPQRVRNFPRYLAKVNYAYRKLHEAEGRYQDALETVRAKNESFVDLDYRRNPELDNALAAWKSIVDEVGEQAVKEASDAYAGDEEMLKSLTDQ